MRSGMKRKGFTLRELCRRAGVDPSLLSKVFSGKRNPPLQDSALLKICEELELSSAEVFVSAGRLPPGWRQAFSNRAVFERAVSVIEGRPVSSSRPDSHRLEDELL